MNLWSLRRLGRIPGLRRVARGVVQFYYRPGTVRTIRSGPLKGAKWSCSRNQVLWMPLGLYEKETAEWLASTIREGMTFFDVGAQVGYFALLGSRLVGDTGRVVAFEPHPGNAASIGTLIAVNELGNVSVENLALAEESGEAEFTLESESANSHLGAISLEHAATRPVETLNVTTRALDEFVAQCDCRPSVIKIDVEGAEMLVLRGGERTLQETRPACLVSTHSDALKTDCRRFLEERGYTVTELAGFSHELVAVPDQG